MATAFLTFTNGGTGSQPFGTYSGVKVIDNFSSTDLVAGNSDPYQGITFYKIEQVYMTVGGTSGTANAARMGLWKSAGVVFDYTNITLNGTAATVSSATSNTVANVGAVIANATTYYAGTWASASLAAKRDTATGSFSMYSGNAISTTVATTYNPGNLQFGLKYTYLPTAPQSFTATANTSSSVDLSWGAPSDPGGYLASTLRYKIKWTASNSGKTGSVEETAANTLSYTVTNLVPGETYTFTVAAMNGVVPVTGSSYSSSDGSVYIDYYSSGPVATSAAVQLKGGVWNGSAWKPMTRAVKFFQSPISFTSGNVGTFSSQGTVTVNTSVQPFATGDTVIISGTTGISGFNGTWLVNSIGGTTNAWTVSFSQGYFNSTPTVANVTTQGTIAGFHPAVIKQYNASNLTWTTIYSSPIV
jgi:hypothetical protein